MHRAPAARGKCHHETKSNCIIPYRVLLSTSLHSLPAALEAPIKDQIDLSQGNISLTSYNAVQLSTSTSPMIPSSTQDISLPASSHITANEATPQPVAPLAEFTLFPKLPPELRLQIWALLCQPRVVTIRSIAGVYLNSRHQLDYDFYADERQGIRTFSGVPIVLQINQESRREGLKHYQLSLSIPNSPILTYLNPSQDILYLSERRTITDENLLRILSRLLGPHQTTKIQHLALGENIFMGRNLHAFAKLIRTSFASLIELVLIVDEFQPARAAWLKRELVTAFLDEGVGFPEGKFPKLVMLAPGELEGRARVT